ncbi:MAG: amidohydrolase family protein [Pirellulales bacterium]
MLKSIRRLRVLAGVAIALGWVSAAGAQADEDEEFVVIKAGRVITMAGDEIVGADLVLVDGKIRLLGKDLSYPPSAQVIDARNETIIPGLIHPRTRWQLPSYTRSGLHGDRSAAKEVFLSEIDFDPFLAAGFTAVCFYPTGSGVPGPGAIYRTAGKAENRDLGAGYLRVTMSNPGKDKKVLRDAITKAKAEIAKVEKARKEWEEKQKKAKEEAAKKKQEKPKEGEKPAKEKKTPSASAKNDEKEEPEKKEVAKPEEKKPDGFVPPKIDPAVLPFVEWLRDKKGPPLLYELYRASDYRHLEQVQKTAPALPMSLFYIASITSPDFHYVIEELGQRKPSVLVQPRIGTLPYTQTRYNLAGELSLAGCKVVVLPYGESRSALKEVRVRLANLVRAGLPRDEALKSVTLYPAELLGIADRLGTIEKGKDADLVFLDGDPLAPAARVTRVMTLGETVWEAP